MKRNWLIWIFIVVSAVNIFAIDLSKWRYQCDVNFQTGAEKYYRFSVTPEVYNAGQVGLGDIRLIGMESEQIPYLINRAKDITTKEVCVPKVINRVTDAAGSNMVTLDFGQQSEKNEIEVETSGNNFRRAVKVEGSNDNVTFYTIIDRGYVSAPIYRTALLLCSGSNKTLCGIIFTIASSTDTGLSS